MQELRSAAREALPDMSDMEVLAELERFDPHCCYGNKTFKHTIQHMILDIVRREKSGFERLKQLVDVANSNYKYLYLISAQELHFRGD